MCAVIASIASCTGLCHQLFGCLYLYRAVFVPVNGHNTRGGLVILLSPSPCNLRPRPVPSIIQPVKYAGFTNLADYLAQRCTQFARDNAEPFNLNRLSQALGWRKSYIYSVNLGRFQPSRDRLTAIAKFFNDDPHILFVLSDLESPPPAIDGDLRELHDLARTLTPSQRRKLKEFAIFLRNSR